MERDADGCVVLEAGITTAMMRSNDFEVIVDWQAVRTLAESGVTYSALAREFKVSRPLIRARAIKEQWLTLNNVEKARADYEEMKIRLYKEHGKLVDAAEVKARLWEERGEKVREDAYVIAEEALAAVKGSRKRMRRLVEDAQSFEKVVKVARQATGLEAKEAQQQAPMAVNVAFLRSAPVAIQEAEVLTLPPGD